MERILEMVLRGKILALEVGLETGAILKEQALPEIQDMLSREGLPDDLKKRLDALLILASSRSDDIIQ
jgi:hypothetical protein